jgi:hypothetical protein
MTAVISPPMFLQFVRPNGVAAGYKLFTYIAGTTTKQATYTDSSMGVSMSNPIVLDANGAASFWLDPTKGYKYVLAPANDSDPPSSPVYTQDNIYGPVNAAILTAQFIGAITNPTTTAEQAAGVTIVNYQYAAYHVDRYATNTSPGTTDMTAAFQAAINAARAAGGGGNIYWGETITYLTNSTLVLASDVLNPVNLICSAVAWFGSPSTTPTITSNIAGATFDCSGTVSTLSLAPLIHGGIIKNSSANAAACSIKSDHSGGLRMEYCWIQAANYGVSAALSFCISPFFLNVHVSPTGATMVSCYKGDFWNAGWVGGRAFSAQYALDVTGTTLGLNDVDFEFCEVICRHQAMTSMVFENCHFESSQVLLTNATTVPINIGGNYTDNGSAGIGILGTVKFIGGTIAMTNSHSNLVVIKTQASFSYRLSFEGVALGTITNPIVGNSFTPGASVALPSGTGISLENQPTGLTIVEPPLDASSASLYANATLPGGIVTSRLAVGTTLGTAMSIILNGTKTFAASTTAAVSFGVTLPSTSYQIMLGPNANKTFWWSAKTTTGFTLNASGSSSDTVDWWVVL